MLRALKATDVASIHEINKDALGYNFSPVGNGWSIC